MAKGNKMSGFIHYNNTKAEFIAAGHPATYNDAIVFIAGDTTSSSCIYTHGKYFATADEAEKYLNTIPYFKGIKVGNTTYNAANGGGYLALAANDPATLTINTNSDGVVIGLTDAAKNAINGAVQSAEGDSKYISAGKSGTKITVFANVETNLATSASADKLPTAKAAKDYTDTAKAALLGNSTTDTKTSKTIEGVIKLIDDKTSGIASEGVVTELSERVKTIEDTYATDSDLSKAISDLNGTPKGEGEFVNVTVTQAAGVVTKVEVVETNIAKASDLGKISDLTTTANTVVGAINEVKTGAAITIDKSEDGLTYVVKQGELEIKTINIPKDMVVESGKYENGNLILTIANGGGDVTIPVGDLIDLYTGGSNPEIAVNVSSENNVISATLVDDGVTTAKIANGAIVTDKIADKAVTRAKLEQGVQDSLALADSAYQVPEGGIPVSALNQTFRNELVRIGEVTNGYTGLKAISTAVGNAEKNAKDYADSLADNYATSAQGTKADESLKKIEIDPECQDYLSVIHYDTARSAEFLLSVMDITTSTAKGEGLADAYDVKQTIEAVFTWEELS